MPEDTGSLSNNIVICLLEDERKNLWIGTDNGLNHLDRTSGQIKQFHYKNGESNSLTNDLINHLYQGRDGLLWICTASGLNRSRSLKT